MTTAFQFTVYSFIRVGLGWAVMPCIINKAHPQAIGTRSMMTVETT